ncbi:hypothetical protein CB0940_02221 [Cercospora beticola]|uniref:Transcription factor domain-containing protein n=1 Tax=Cercospora beticola TaxID=122368 RepID=A0A2G5I9B8_CERBT|nr:hypothetical protein CB0940_02221 [Cercospora beticola]PIB01379.1 hypothetical protein CB0940_02221 [Cercospora beticola]WPA97624.1 hypothetical protein RHO25_002234 [Cercospora beticola]
MQVSPSRCASQLSVRTDTQPASLADSRNNHVTMADLLALAVYAEENKPIVIIEIGHSRGSANPRLADDPEPEEQQQRYAGFIGASSHATIFDELGRESGEDPVSTLSQQQVAVPSPINAPPAAECVTVIEHLLHDIDHKAVSGLIHFWLAKGTSMTLAAPLLPTAIDLTLQAISTWQESASDLCAHLHKLSSAPLTNEFPLDFGCFTHEVFAILRWEGILLLLIAAGRAVIDIHHFPILYNDRKARRKLQQDFLSCAERCLEAALSRDCANDLLLICQFETWILYTMVRGDQNFDSWRKLGDVISSLLFLGLNEEVLAGLKVPGWLADLRRAIFAVTYGADKHNAVFTGRPPRLNRNFCCFQLPCGPVGSTRSVPEEFVESGRYTLSDLPLAQDAALDNSSAIRWMAICALLKEEALELLRRPNCPNRSQAIDTLITQAISLWSRLPGHFKITDTLPLHDRHTPYELDLVLDCRLQYLQILFLLYGGARRDGPEIQGVSEEILSLVVDAVILRDRVVNSGTSLIWKVSNFGLRAAGLIALSLLRVRRGTLVRPLGKRAVPDLCVIIREIQGGGFVAQGEPNYDLLFRAASSIQRLLNQIIPDLSSPARAIDSEQPVPAQDRLPLLDTMLPLDTWETEFGFWQWLDEQPV